MHPSGTPGTALEPPADGDLAAAIAARRTDRRLLSRTKIDPRHLADLVELAQRSGDARLRLVTGERELDAVAGIVAASDRLRLLNPPAPPSSTSARSAGHRSRPSAPGTASTWPRSS